MSDELEFEYDSRVAKHRADFSRIILYMILFGVLGLFSGTAGLFLFSYIAILPSALALIYLVKRDRWLILLADVASLSLLFPTSNGCVRVLFSSGLMMMLGAPIFFYSVACILINRIKTVYKTPTIIIAFLIYNYLVMYIYSWLYFNLA